MSTAREPISVRTMRLNHLILGHSKATSKTSKAVADALSREGLLDAFCLLYHECDKDFLRKRDKTIADFITKYRPIVDETHSLRVSSEDFSVKALIGKGYFGNVHLVTEKTTGDVYAMKKIKKSVVTNFQVKEERDIMARRDSEWITCLQYAFQDTDYLYLVMEYLPGGDLLSLMIRNGAFDEDLAKFYLAELTLAINALHNMGYVHRDIKPENILIDRFGHVKLADFGNAAALNKDGHVISLSPVGTPDYIAPELLQTISSYKLSKSKHDVGCDFWSMGIIGYELIYETTPFHEDNVHETYSKILSHCDDTKPEIITFPADVKISAVFKNFIEGLVIKPSRRFNYQQIVKHEFFKDVKWDRIRQEVPPIIPTVNADDDISNFEDVERHKRRRSTFVKRPSGSLLKANEFSGKDLPFLGYGFIHEEKTEQEAFEGEGNAKINKLMSKTKELQKVISQQSSEIKTLQENLLKAEKNASQSHSQNKILKDAKEEMNRMKERLKEKTIELASCRTEIRTLQSSLKIEEEMRLKSDATISEVLSSTYQKWEKAKSLSDQNYEKQIAEKKTEISNITERLKACESELSVKSEECDHLQEKIENYKELLKSIKDQSHADKVDFEKNKMELMDAYETKIIELRNKLKMERDSKSKLSSELKEVRNELDESICSTNSNQQAKLVTEKNVGELKTRLNKEIETNRNLRSENATVEKKRVEIEKTCDSLKSEVDKLRKELQLIEASKNLQADSALSSPYITAHGSLTDLNSIEEQLRHDLLTAKENEDVQRKRAEKLEKVVSRLEDMIAKLSEQPNSVGDMLEKQNEKLEDKLATAREQVVIERQSARTANLSLWKLEKQVEDLQCEKRVTQRRMNLTEEKIKKVQDEKSEVERKLKDAQAAIKQKESTITELKEDIKNLKADLSNEHKMWEKSEQERIKEKSEVIEHISKVHKLEEEVAEFKRKLSQATQKSDGLSIENNRLIREMNDQRDRISSMSDKINELQMKLKSSHDNYEMLKVACTITDTQLTEIEAMLDAEMKRNKANMEKIEGLCKSVRDKDEKIAKLKHKIDEETAGKLSAKARINELQSEVANLKKYLEEAQRQVISQQEELIEKTTNLFEAQEKIELISSDCSTMQTMNGNHEKEIAILKEENSRILTEVFLAKEEGNRLSRELKEATQMICELKQEIEQLTGTLDEQKNYYLQRDIKAEATLAQHKKLIDYLQLKVEDLSQKKKKSLADKIFGTGTGTTKKENISPNAFESSILYRTLQEELKREKQRNEQLREQLEKARQQNRLSKIETSPRKERTDSVDSSQQFQQDKKDTSRSRQDNSSTGTRRRTYQTHRFELNLESSDNIEVNCVACHKHILPGSPHWRCRECAGCAHRKCRSDVQTSCDGMDMISLAQSKDIESISIKSEQFNADPPVELISQYQGDMLFKGDVSSPPLEINCVFEIAENVVLLGCTSGLYAYHQDTRNLISIGGIESVACIAVTSSLSKAILIGASGEYLYQCDLRHLQSRSQASACLKPKLEASILDLPFANRASNEKWHLVKISSETDEIAETVAIAATSTRIVIMKYDLHLQRFKPVRALDTATAVSSILYTRHTAIVSSDKFFEIELSSYSAEEFIDLSDATLAHTRNCQPMSAFRISPQEFLLCFVECGIFVDEYGCRSRPYDVNWEYTPTGFVYREPLLYISHFQIVQVMRIHRSYRNEMSHSITTDDEEPNFVRAYINLYMPSILGDNGKLNVFAMGVEKSTNLQEFYMLDGIKAFKSNANISLETLASEATCVTLDSVESTDTS